MDTQELDKRFKHHPPVGDQQERYEKIRAAARAFAEVLNDLCPESREKSLAITNLETAQFFANASIARNE